MSSQTQERYRLIVLGSGKVGKTCIIRRYLNNTYNERYKETVEDIYSRDLCIEGALLPLDIYDTNFYYPDMWKLNIISANAFLLVFAVNDVKSFKDATDIMQEILRRRSGCFNTIPIVVAGNKSDEPEKKIFRETMDAWLSTLSYHENVRYLEVSAKDSTHIVDIFRTLLHLSGFPHNMAQNGTQAAAPFLTPNPTRRNRSVRAKSPNRTLSERKLQLSPVPPSSGGAVERIVAETAGFGGRLTRHASLMRRSPRASVRVKHVDAEEDNSDCLIS